MNPAKQMFEILFLNIIIEGRDLLIMLEFGDESVTVDLGLGFDLIYWLCFFCCYRSRKKERTWIKKQGRLVFAEVSRRRIDMFHEVVFLHQVEIVTTPTPHLFTFKSFSLSSHKPTTT